MKIHTAMKCICGQEPICGEDYPETFTKTPCYYLSCECMFAEVSASSLGGAIDAWNTAVANYDPSPYCNGGHRGPKDCNCDEIYGNRADNE